MLLSILFLFLNSTDIPTKQVPETKYAILSYILKLRIKKSLSNSLVSRRFLHVFGKRTRRLGKRFTFTLSRRDFSTYRISEI